jgi:uncharacterized membrane protein YdjX (TVP38/TMEM64 family)
MSVVNKQNIIILVVVLLIAGFVLQQSGVIDIEALGEWVQGLGWVGLLLYGILFILLGLLGVSKIAMTVLAGVLFGVYQAMVMTVIAATIAAVIAFFIARHFQNFLHRKLNKDRAKAHHGKWQKLIYKIEQNAEKRGFFTIAILRLAFVPLMMTSYSAGLIKSLKFIEFFWAILLTNIYMHFVYIFVGTSWQQNLPIFLLAIVLLILFLQTPKIVKKYSGD